MIGSASPLWSGPTAVTTICMKSIQGSGFRVRSPTKFIWPRRLSKRAGVRRVWAFYFFFGDEWGGLMPIGRSNRQRFRAAGSSRTDLGRSGFGSCIASSSVKLRDYYDNRRRPFGEPPFLRHNTCGPIPALSHGRECASSHADDASPHESEAACNLFSQRHLRSGDQAKVHPAGRSDWC